MARSYIGGARCTTMDKLLDKNDSNMNLTWEKKK